MQYMQAHLVNRMNDESLDQAGVVEEWEKSCDAYHQRLAAIQGSLPDSARCLLRNFCLHDAEMTNNTDWSSAVRVFMFARYHYTADDKPMQDVILLEYELGCAVEQEKHWGPGFGDGPVIWLYDEFDIDDQGRYLHSILFSNGLEVKIAFTKFTWLRARVEEEY